MFTTFTPYQTQEIEYRREELRRAWGHRSTKTGRRAVRARDAGSARVALAS